MIMVVCIVAVSDFVVVVCPFQPICYSPGLESSVFVSP